MNSLFNGSGLMNFLFVYLNEHGCLQRCFENYNYSRQVAAVQPQQRAAKLSMHGVF